MNVDGKNVKNVGKDYDNCAVSAHATQGLHAKCHDDKIELSPVKKDLKLTFKNVISEHIIRENTRRHT